MPWGLICVDDGSSDSTLARFVRRGTAPRATREADPVEPQLRSDCGDAGRHRCRARGFIAALNGDLQNDPADIPRMVAELIQCDLDLLQAAAARNSAGMPVAGWGR